MENIFTTCIKKIKSVQNFKQTLRQDKWCNGKMKDAMMVNAQEREPEWPLDVKQNITLSRNQRN